MRNYQNIIVDMIRSGVLVADSSEQNDVKNEYPDAEAWSLLALRGAWLHRWLEQLSDAESWSKDVALRVKLHESGVLCELLRSLEGQAGPRDHKRWARRILARIAAGETGVKPYQARAALEALCAPEVPDYISVVNELLPNQ